MFKTSLLPPRCDLGPRDRSDVNRGDCAYPAFRLLAELGEKRLKVLSFHQP